VVIWRGQHLLPAANAGSWDVGSNQVFLLGDHPSASRDSRHFGPVDEVHLRRRLP
jgi:type IV secretory pathway protease TraF